MNKTLRLILTTGVMLDIMEHKFDIEAARRQIAKHCDDLSYLENQFIADWHVYNWANNALNTFINSENEEVLTDAFTAILAEELAECLDGIIVRAHNLDEDYHEYLVLPTGGYYAIAYRINTMVKGKCNGSINGAGNKYEIKWIKDSPTTEEQEIFLKALALQTKELTAWEEEDWRTVNECRKEKIRTANEFNLEDFKRKNGFR